MVSGDDGNDVGDAGSVDGQLPEGAVQVVELLVRLEIQVGPHPAPRVVPFLAVLGQLGVLHCSEQKA